MCGIIAVAKRENNGKNTASEVLAMFEQQRERGVQGFGYVSFDEKVKKYARFSQEVDVRKSLSSNEAISMLFHHRIPTSTPNYADTTHPIKVSHDELLHDYYVIHNGMISNDSIMHDEHVALGYEYNTTVRTEIKTLNNSFVQEQWNDSEAFAIDLVRFIEGKQDKIKSKGSIAFIALQVDKKNSTALRMYFGHNEGNPLTFNCSDGQFVLRSKGEKYMIQPDTLQYLDLKTWTYSSVDVPIGEWYIARPSTYGNNNADRFKDGFPPYDDDYYNTSDSGYGKKNRYKKADDIDVEIILKESDRLVSKLTTEIEEIDGKIEVVSNDIDYYEEYYPDCKDLIEGLYGELGTLQLEKKTKTESLEAIIEGDITI